MLTVIAIAGMNGSPGVRNASAYLKRKGNSNASSLRASWPWANEWWIRNKPVLRLTRNDH